MAVPDDDTVVYTPARPDGAHGRVIFETRPVGDGRQVALAFTSVEALAEALGAWWKEDVVGLKDRIGSSAKGLWNSVFG